MMMANYRCVCVCARARVLNEKLKISPTNENRVNSQKIVETLPN